MKGTSYPTWYEFKQDLQKEAGHTILTKEWLSIKPRDPLPWDARLMKSVLSKYKLQTTATDMKVRVDRDLCIGLGNCVAYASTVFALDEQNKATVINPESVDDKTLLEAAESCPVNAIIIEDDEGHQIYP